MNFRKSSDLAVNLVNMELDELSKKVEVFVEAIFIENPQPKLFYHNLRHTQTVKKRATELASFYQLDSESLFILQTAAWFHDIGHLFVGAKDHEAEGVRRMRDFLDTIEVDQRITDKVSECIMATKLPTHPSSLCEEIICDSDTYHFGTEEFKTTDNLVKKELESITGINFLHWTQGSITMLEHHEFYTGFCKKNLEAGKKKNIEWLKSQL